ncbi:MAG: uracil-DNA glycosylase [Magnetococcales bacterium]|nr:uracil-DNA glycosylase [Magnetococcales bacterium]
MNPADLGATLDYWRTAGIQSLSSDRLRFPPEPAPRLPLGLRQESDPVAAPPGTGKGRPPFTFSPTAEPDTPARSLPVAPLPPVHMSLVTEALPLEKRTEKMNLLSRSLTDCARCVLSGMRKKMVFGVGNLEADVVFVGEGPGAEEDLRGEPFVGDAGKLLDKMIHSIELQRHQVYIANVVKCRPPGNRNPLPAEIDQCQPFLFEQLETIRPKVIFALGRFAILCLTGFSGPLDKIRGTTPLWRGLPVIPSYHPAFYLRSPSRKKAAWDDLIRLKKMLATHTS